MDREAWHAANHGVTKSWTGLSDWSELNWRTELSYLIHTNKHRELGKMSRDRNILQVKEEDKKKKTKQSGDKLSTW